MTVFISFGLSQGNIWYAFFIIASYMLLKKNLYKNVNFSILMLNKIKSSYSEILYPPSIIHYDGDLEKDISKTKKGIIFLCLSSLQFLNPSVFGLGCNSAQEDCTGTTFIHWIYNPISISVLVIVSAIICIKQANKLVDWTHKNFLQYTDFIEKKKN